MPVVNYEQYCRMLDNAYNNHYAYPAFNVSNMETVSAVLAGLQEANSDGIIQVSIGGASYASGSTIKDKVLGAIALANYVQLVSDSYNVNVALHTDHCKLSNVDDYLIPLIEETERRRENGLPNLFCSHMFDGSDILLSKNLEISQKLLEKCHKNGIVLEIEIGVVGGEEDGVNNEGVANEKLYSTPEDMIQAYQALEGVGGTYMMAATFGNVHGVYKPGNVKLRPKVLRDGQQALKAQFGEDKSFKFVQYAFTRPVADHVFKNYDGILKIEGNVGVKAVYDPRSYLKKAQANMARRVVEACRDLRSVKYHINF